MVEDNTEFSSSKTGRVRKKTMKMLEMEEMVSDDRSDRLEMSWTEAGFDDVDYFQLLKDSTPDQSSSSTLAYNKLNKKDGSAGKSSNKQHRKYYTAYKAWCSHMSNKESFRSLSGVQMQRRLKEMWQNVSKEEKSRWRKRAHVMSKNGEQLMEDYCMLTDLHVEERAKTNSTEAIDLAAHLRLLSESLNNIGTRLVDHKGKIAVQGSLSVLLDSLVCMLACLLGSTRKIDGKVGERVDRALHEELLDDVAYIMPGIG